MIGQVDRTARSRDTGMALVLLCLLAYLWTGRGWLIPTAIAAQIVTMTAPRVLAPLAVVWFAFAQLLGEGMSRVLLTAIFFLLVTPVGLVRRAMGRDPLRLRGFKKGDGSVLTVRDRQFAAADLDRPY